MPGAVFDKNLCQDDLYAHLQRNTLQMFWMLQINKRGVEPEFSPSKLRCQEQWWNWDILNIQCLSHVGNETGFTFPAFSSRTFPWEFPGKLRSALRLETSGTALSIYPWNRSMQRLAHVEEVPGTWISSLWHRWLWWCSKAWGGGFRSFVSISVDSFLTYFYISNEFSDLPKQIHRSTSIHFHPLPSSHIFPEQHQSMW